MATFILRPGADISVEHELMPSDSTSGYLLINEEICDEDSTYIKHDIETSSNSGSYISQFELSGLIPDMQIEITDIKVCCYLKTTIESTSDSAENTLSLVLGDIEASTVISGEMTSYTLVESSGFDSDGTFKNAINNYISSNNGTFPSLQLSINSNLKSSGSDKGSSKVQTCISQIYVELTYEEIKGLNIHTKSNGAWLQAQAVYQKQSGAWTEITEEECKSILQSNLIASTTK